MSLERKPLCVLRLIFPFFDSFMQKIISRYILLILSSILCCPLSNRIKTSSQKLNKDLRQPQQHTEAPQK